ncbi:MAG: hypothetical protein JNM80_05365 [Phycisphaerae bacterium]|nr:hypothetical protein [Phycisphaerae bacterium]
MAVTEAMLSGVRAEAERAGVFGEVVVRGGMLVCRAKGPEAPASYRVFGEGGRVWVSLVMADRWLSESIESDLMHTGDKIEDLVAEELAELGEASAEVRVEHFRSDDLLFTFRTPIPASAAGSVAGVTRWLLAYEACFRRLGDMGGEGDQG